MTFPENDPSNPAEVALAFVVVTAVRELRAKWAETLPADLSGGTVERYAGYLLGAQAVLIDLEKLIGRSAMDALITDRAVA